MVMLRHKTLLGMITVKILVTGAMIAMILVMLSTLSAGIPIKVTRDWVFQNGMLINSILLIMKVGVAMPEVVLRKNLI